MERRGPYNKGRAGHARNAGSYRILKEHYKKWRFPINGLLALVLLFGVAPMVGQDFQSSILTTPETTEMIHSDLEVAKKTVLEYAHDVIQDCREYRMNECVTDGEAMINDIATKDM